MEQNGKWTTCSASTGPGPSRGLWSAPRAAMRPAPATNTAPSPCLPPAASPPSFSARREGVFSALRESQGRLFLSLCLGVSPFLANLWTLSWVLFELLTTTTFNFTYWFCTQTSGTPLSLRDVVYYINEQDPLTAFLFFSLSPRKNVLESRLNDISCMAMHRFVVPSGHITSLISWNTSFPTFPGDFPSVPVRERALTRLHEEDGNLLILPSHVFSVLMECLTFFKFWKKVPQYRKAVFNHPPVTVCLWGQPDADNFCDPF